MHEEDQGIPDGVWQGIMREYGAAFDLPLRRVGLDGRLLDPLSGREVAHAGLAVLNRARCDAISEGMRWGETYTFFVAPGIMSWITPVADGDRCLGGLSGGEVIPAHAGDEREYAVRKMVAAGCATPAARAYVQGCVLYDEDRARQAAESLYQLLYSRSGLNDGMLRRKREDAAQQREIAEEIHEQKAGTRRLTTLEEERKLMSLIRVGDRNGARRVLNRMLANMFLYSPRQPVVQARAIEMMGYLLRAAVEDNPLLEPLLEQHQEWIERILGAGDFEELCAALRVVLDDFMTRIHLQGHNRTNLHVRRAMDYLADHYTRPVRLEEVSAEVGISPFRLAHLVKEHTGKSLIRHVRTLRIQEACRLLEETEQSYEDIARTLGFADQSYFIKKFRALMGTTPARYRRERRGRGTEGPAATPANGWVNNDRA